MKFYDFLRIIAVGIVWAVTGRIKYMNKDRIPTDDNYILVGPHRTWWDPVWYAIAAYPKPFIFMAKIELFKFKPLALFRLIAIMLVQVSLKHLLEN